MADILIRYVADADSLRATVSEANTANNSVGESATKAGKDAAAAFKEAGAAGKAAFATTESKKALDILQGSVEGLGKRLGNLIAKEKELLVAGKQASEAYKKNQTDLTNLKSEIQKTTNELNKFKKVEEQVKKTTDQVTVAAKSLKGQLTGLKQQLTILEQQGKENTKEFNNILIAAARLEDQIGDTREKVRVLASDTFIFDAAVDSVTTLTGAFSIGQGVIGLFAEDSEELQKAIAKTQSALAILNGTQQVANFLTGQSAGKLAILSAAQSVYTLVVGTSTGALRVFKIALAGTGIGIAILAIAELISYFSRLGTESKRTSENLQKAAEAIKNSGEQLESFKERFISAQQGIDLLTGKITKAQSEINETRRKGNKDLTDSYGPLADAARDLLTRQFTLTGKLTELEKERYEIQKRGQATSFIEKQITDAKKEQLAVSGALNDLNRQYLSLKIDGNKAINKEIELIGEQEKADNKSSEGRKKGASEEKRDRLEIIALQLTEADIANANAFRAEQIQKKQAEARELEIAQRRFLSEFEDTSRSGQLSDRISFLRTTELNEGTSLDIRIAQIEEHGKLRLTEENLTSFRIKEIEAETQDAIRKERKKTNDDTFSQIFTYVNVIADVFHQINELSKQSTQFRIDDVNRLKEAQIKAINDSLDTERSKERQRAAITLQAQRAIDAAKLKQARRDKAIAIATTVINTAQSIVRTGAQLGYPAAIPFQIAAGIIGAAQVAIITRQKFAKGGEASKGFQRGKRHAEGGIDINVEDQEFIVRQQQTNKHRDALEAMNRSSKDFDELMRKQYGGPTVIRFMSESKSGNKPIIVNNTLNSKGMERSIEKLVSINKKEKKQHRTHEYYDRTQWRRA